MCPHFLHLVIWLLGLEHLLSSEHRPLQAMAHERQPLLHGGHSLDQAPMQGVFSRATRLKAPP